MSTAEPLLRANLRPASPPAPHVFLPAVAEPPRDLKALFELKRRPGYYNATAKAALLRRSTKAPHDQLFVDFSRPEVHVELRGNGIWLASGLWTWQATAAGEPLASRGVWSAVRWDREDRGDYLEIELPLSRGWKLCRQMLLARDDRFLLLADCLLGPAADAVEMRHTQSFPLAAEAAFEPARQTRDGLLTASGRPRATVVPPALAEWRSEFCHAELAANSGRLTLQQAALGRHLYAPLWIDLDPRRLRRPLTWRRLTVGENLAAVPRDTAVAYRIQAGRQQWVIYRSLAPPASRSFLGYNTLFTFVCLRFLAGSKMEEIMEIE